MNPISLMDLEKEWDKMNQAEIDQFVEYINHKLIQRDYLILQPYHSWDNNVYSEDLMFEQPFFQDVLDKYTKLGYTVQISYVDKVVKRSLEKTNRPFWKFWEDEYKTVEKKAPLKVLTITPKLEKK